MTESSADYEFLLTNQFFTDIDAPEIQKGKLQVQLNVRKTMGVYVLTFHIEGSVIVPCDRCLDDMELPVVTDDTLKVKLGETFSDEEDMVIVPEDTAFYRTSFESDKDFKQQLDIIYDQASVKNKDLKVNASDKYLVLSTCREEDETIRANLYLRQIPDSEMSDFVAKHGKDLEYTPTR